MPVKGSSQVNGWARLVPLREVAEAGDIDAHELQLGGEVGPLKILIATGEVLRDNVSAIC